MQSGNRKLPTRCMSKYYMNGGLGLELLNLVNTEFSRNRLYYLCLGNSKRLEILFHSAFDKKKTSRSSSSRE
jgi:hypothetical protein